MIPEGIHPVCNKLDETIVIKLSDVSPSNDFKEKIDNIAILPDKVSNNKKNKKTTELIENNNLNFDSLESIKSADESIKDDINILGIDQEEIAMQTYLFDYYSKANSNNNPNEKFDFNSKINCDRQSNNLIVEKNKNKGWKESNKNLKTEKSWSNEKNENSQFHYIINLSENSLKNDEIEENNNSIRNKEFQNKDFDENEITDQIQDSISFNQDARKNDDIHILDVWQNFSNNTKKSIDQILKNDKSKKTNLEKEENLNLKIERNELNNFSQEKYFNSGKNNLHNYNNLGEPNYKENLLPEFDKNILLFDSKKNNNKSLKSIEQKNNCLHQNMISANNRIQYKSIC